MTKMRVHTAILVRGSHRASWTILFSPVALMVATASPWRARRARLPTPYMGVKWAKSNRLPLSGMNRLPRKAKMLIEAPAMPTAACAGTHSPAARP